MLRDLTKVYGEGETAVHALRGLSLDVAAGEYVAIMGASGSGKSTLMHIVGCLDVGTGGRYLLDGVDIATLDSYALSVLRNRKIGFVFQSFNLIPRTTAFANVELPMVYANVSESRTLPAGNGRARGRRARRARRRAPEPAVGRSATTGRDRAGDRDRSVDHPRRRTDRCPRQRVDRRSARHLRPAQREGRTVIMITHEADVAAHAQRTIRLRDGLIIEDTGHASIVTPIPEMSAS